jgi:hypothetical protein
MVVCDTLQPMSLLTILIFAGLIKAVIGLIGSHLLRLLHSRNNKDVERSVIWLRPPHRQGSNTEKLNAE